MMGAVGKTGALGGTGAQGETGVLGETGTLGETGAASSAHLPYEPNLNCYQFCLRISVRTPCLLHCTGSFPAFAIPVSRFPFSALRFALCASRSLSPTCCVNGYSAAR